MTKDEVDKATVTLTKKGGRGVLVNDNIILTAAHCVDFSCEGAMVLGDYFIEDIETCSGKLKACPLAVEPVNDIAALCSLDSQEFYDESSKFEEFCENTKPVPLFLKETERFKEFRVHLRTAKGLWVSGKAQRCGDRGSPVFWIDTDESIERGASGGPIINGRGQLVGIVSVSGGPGEGPFKSGQFPRPHLALPVWVSRRILGEKFNRLKGGAC